MMKPPLALLLSIGVFTGVSSSAESVPVESFGAMSDGRAVHLHTLENESGLRAVISDYGATLVSLEVPDRTGQVADVVLGFRTLEEYRTKSPYFGCVVGRVGNRIANGRFSLDGQEYTLKTNNFPAGIPCHLHGGERGFDKVLWTAEAFSRDGLPALRLKYRSVDGEEGYPGNLDAEVVYAVTENNELRIEYTATADKPTPVNLTNHSYFNLRGEGHETILDHELTIHAARFTPVTAGLIPTGEYATVAGTPLDFNEPHLIGERIEADNEQLKFGIGYDHNYLIDGPAGELRPAATVRDPASGRIMNVLTTEPGMQFYSGNYLDGKTKGKSGQPHAYRSGLALETQHYPDSVNQPNFPSTILRPGQTYRTTTVYRFSAK